MKKSFLLAGVVAALFLTGCAPSVKNIGISSKSTKASFSQAKTKNDYINLYKKIKEENKTDDLLWTYKAGTIANWVDKYKESVNHFDSSENLIKKYDQEVLAGKLLANVGAVLTNDTFMDYRPKIYEKIMVNTYKGMDFILLGDRQNARIEFNRALVRQDRAKEFFQKEIQTEKKKLAKKSKDKKSLDLASKSMKNKKTMDPIEKKYTNLFAFKPYPDFVNPFTTYLSGVYFLSIGDYSKATDLLKECYGMIKGLNDGDRYVLADFKLADRMKGSLATRKQKYTWVFFVNGQGPIKKELRINIPLFLFSDKVYYTGIALPTLKMRPRAYDYLYVKKGKKRYKTKIVASMDTIVKTEFKKRFPTIVTRALARTIAQTVIQKQLHDKGGFIGGLIGAVYQGAMNRADTRMWDSLPKEFQVVRVPTSQRIEIFTSTNKKIASFNTNPNKNYILFVTIPTKQNTPIVAIQKF